MENARTREEGPCQEDEGVDKTLSKPHSRIMCAGTVSRQHRASHECPSGLPMESLTRLPSLPRSLLRNKPNTHRYICDEHPSQLGRTRGCGIAGKRVEGSF